MDLGSEMDELIIVGGGIGGLAAALASAKAGMKVRVLERASEFSEIGAGLQLAPNATRILQSLGVLDEVVSKGVLPDRLVFSDALTGQSLSHLSLDDNFRGRYGGPYVVVHRSDLLETLVQACGDAGVVLENGKDVLEYDETSLGATVRCADGSEYSGFAVVAADGLKSRFRSRLCGDEPVDSGYVAYRGTTPLEAGSTGSHLNEVRAWFGPGLHLVQYPLRGGTMYNQVAVFRSKRFLAGEDEWGTPDELDEAFSVTCEAVRKALPGLWRHQWWHMADRLPTTNWAEGRLALLGDAAHPMLQYLAQGACQAIEDGAELARILSRASTSPEQVSLALRSYAEARMPRTAQVQRTARIWGEIWHIEGLGASLRNEVFRQRAAEDMSRVDWLYGPAAGA